jgi:hypothetical protein
MRRLIPVLALATVLSTSLFAQTLNHRPPNSHNSNSRKLNRNAPTTARMLTARERR